MKRAHSLSKSSSGFTLIELMVVFAIVASLLTLVGPFAMNSIERAEAKTELLTFKNWVDFQSKAAGLKGVPFVIRLNGKQIKVFENETLRETKAFEYLFFTPQVVTVYATGRVSPAELKVNTQTGPLNVSFDSWDISDEN